MAFYMITEYLVGNNISIIEIPFKNISYKPVCVQGFLLNLISGIIWATWEIIWGVRDWTQISGVEEKPYNHYPNTPTLEIFLLLFPCHQMKKKIACFTRFLESVVHLFWMKRDWLSEVLRKFWDSSLTWVPENEVYLWPFKYRTIEIEYELGTCLSCDLPG